MEFKKTIVININPSSLKQYEVIKNHKTDNPIR